jgi:hypothetical protein
VPGTVHSQHPVAEGYAARTHPEFVVLDIGGEVGALIVHTDPDMHGVEIEISPSEDLRRRSHKQVLERTIGDHPAFTAVFDALPAGRYTLWVDGKPRTHRVPVQASAVAELDLRSRRGSPRAHTHEP